MNQAQYAQIQAQILAFARLVRIMDLDGFLAAADRAGNAGPILDPTLWQKTQANLADVQTLARGLKRFQDAVKEVEARYAQSA